MTVPVSSFQSSTEAYPAPWKSTNAVKASNFGSVGARVTSLTPDPAKPGAMTQFTIAKVFGGLHDDPAIAKELAASPQEGAVPHG